MLCSRCRCWEENILIAEIEELEKLDASEKYPRRLNAKEVLITREDGEFVVLVENSRVRIGCIAFTVEASKKRCTYTRTEGRQTLSSRFLICFDNNASEAEVVTDIKKSRKVNCKIH